MTEERFLVGRILAPWGLRGAVSIEVITTNPERFKRGHVVYADGVPLTLSTVRTVSAKVVLEFREITTHEAADALRGVYLDVPADDLPELGPDQYYQHQILGLRVITVSGQEIGKVDDILATGANDVYVIKTDKREYLIPAIGDVVQSIDLKSGVITIDPLPGLLD